MTVGVCVIVALLASVAAVAFHLSDGKPGGVFAGHYADLSRVAGCIAILALVFALVALTARAA